MDASAIFADLGVSPQNAARLPPWKQPRKLLVSEVGAPLFALHGFFPRAATPKMCFHFASSLHHLLVSWTTLSCMYAFLLSLPHPRSAVDQFKRQFRSLEDRQNGVGSNTTTIERQHASLPR